MQYWTTTIATDSSSNDTISAKSDWGMRTGIDLLVCHCGIPLLVCVYIRLKARHLGEL